MPEGDTIHRLARRFQTLLLGETLTSVALPDRLSTAKLRGKTVTSVDAVGKHLLITVDGRIALRTHLGMWGRWDTHRPGERWKGPKRLVTLVLATPRVELVLFDGKSWELVATDRAKYGKLAQLGPDLGVSPANVSAAAYRAIEQGRGDGTLTVADCLLDQRIAAGIGNVYKSEALFRHAVDPWQLASKTSFSGWVELFSTASDWLVLNIRHSVPGSYRVTTGLPRRQKSALWVYDRAGRPCLRCGAVIAVKRQGELARVTFWCPNCQRPGLG